MAEAVMTAAPTVHPVSAAEALAHVREDAAEQSGLIEGLIAAAAEVVQERAGRALSVQGWTQKLDGFPSGDIVLPVGPVTAVTSISYLDAAGVSQVLSTSAYSVDTASIEARIRPVDAWPQTSDAMNSVTIVWTAGGNCPAALKQAILLLVGHWYENRAAAIAAPGAAEIPLGVKALIDSKRRFRG